MAFLRVTAMLALAPALLPAPPDIRVNVDLGQIEVVGADSKGRHIPDQDPGDFRLTVGGRERRISALSFIGGTTDPPPSPGALRRDDVRRAIVFMVDASSGRDRPAGGKESGPRQTIDGSHNRSASDWRHTIKTRCPIRLMPS